MNAPRRSDPFPIVLGAIIGALVIGLMVVVYLISSNNSTGGANGGTTGGTTGGSTAGGGQPTVVANLNSTSQPDNATLPASGTAGPTEEPAPRMPLADFKKLYDDPAKRPLIIDVRAKEAYDAGHIRGAISFPESDVDTRIAELPKDKLIIAYCQ